MLFRSKDPDPKALFDPDAKKTADTKNGKSGSQGDDENKAGDKGNPEGKIDAQALYGTPGGGGGGHGAHGAHGVNGATGAQGAQGDTGAQGNAVVGNANINYINNTHVSGPVS